MSAASASSQPFGGPTRSCRAPEAALSASRGWSLSADWSGIAAIMLFGLVARVVVALTMPPWQSPDEPKHFEYIRVLIDQRSALWAERRLPAIGDTDPAFQRAVIASLAKHWYWERVRQPRPSPLPEQFADVWSLGRHTQLHRPSLYYLFAAPFLMPFTGAPLETQLTVVRLFSAVLSTLTVWVVFVATRVVVRHDPVVPLASAAFVAALPMHVYIGASVNNDNLVTLLGSLTIFGLVRGLREGFGRGTWLLVLGAFVLGLATKRVMVGLAPPILLAGLIWLLSLPGWRLGLGLGSLAAAMVLVLDALGPGIGLRWLPLERFRGLVVEYALNHPSQLEQLQRVSLSSSDVWQIIVGHQVWFFRSFWGVFGWFALPLSPDLYGLLAVTSGICLLGCLWWVGGQAARASSGQTVARRNLVIALVCLVAIAAIVVLAEGERLAYMSAGEIPQGRYLFAVVAPIGMLLAIGARALLPSRLLGARVPLAIILVSLVALDVEVFAEYLLPFFLDGHSA